MPKRGRPKTKNPRNKVIHLRLSEKEEQDLVNMAIMADEPIADVVRDALEMYKNKLISDRYD